MIPEKLNMQQQHTVGEQTDLKPTTRKLHAGNPDKAHWVG